MRYKISCPIANNIRPEWDYLTNYKAGDGVTFKDYTDDASYILIKKNDVIFMMTEMNRCDYARKGLLDLIKTADKLK